MIFLSVCDVIALQRNTSHCTCVQAISSKTLSEDEEDEELVLGIFNAPHVYNSM